MNTTENRTKLLERAKKLFAMAQGNANENEAAIAMRRLSSMMDKYSFTEEELSKQDNHQFNDVGAGKTFNSPIPKWYMVLALVAANITDTKSYMNVSGKTRHMRFRGMNGDDALAVMLFEYLLEAQARELKKFKKETGAKGQDALFAFRIGFSYRMFDRSIEIKEQREAAQQAVSSTGQSLTVIKQDLIKEHYDPLTKGRKRKAPSVADVDAFSAGTEAGNRVSLNTQVGGSKAAPQLN